MHTYQSSPCDTHCDNLVTFVVATTNLQCTGKPWWSPFASVYFWFGEIRSVGIGCSKVCIWVHCSVLLFVSLWQTALTSGGTLNLVFLSRGGFIDMVWFAFDEGNGDVAKVACSRQQIAVCSGSSSLRFSWWWSYWGVALLTVGVHVNVYSCFSFLHLELTVVMTTIR